ncbi:MAG: hypothetical protein CMM61_00560 [Rhodospirillaceae bacterium]|nr:hypothetical protein [Rhodospirillaceae bacterium]
MPGVPIFAAAVRRLMGAATAAAIAVAAASAAWAQAPAHAPADSTVEGVAATKAARERAKKVAAERAKRYGECMATARRRPQDGFEDAIAWRAEGGGTAADHCAAVALIGLEQYSEAANRLERLAQDSLAEPEVKAGLWDQAGQAWLLDERPENAIRAFTSAIGLMPGAPDMLIDRAQAWAAKGDYSAAEADLSAALNLAPSRDDVYALRASARRYLDRTEDALADANTALELNPGNPEALLERGILRRMKGDDAGARTDWMKILNAMPDTAAAGPARQNIETMDVKPEGAAPAPAPMGSDAPPRR